MDHRVVVLSSREPLLWPRKVRTPASSHRAPKLSKSPKKFPKRARIQFRLPKSLAQSYPSAKSTTSWISRSSASKPPTKSTTIFPTHQSFSAVKMEMPVSAKRASSSPNRCRAVSQLQIPQQAPKNHLINQIRKRLLITMSPMVPTTQIMTPSNKKNLQQWPE